MSTASAYDATRLVVFFLGVTTTTKPLLQSDQICTAAPPTWRAKDVGGNDTYGITGIPSTIDGRGVVQRAGLTGSTKIIYPGSGREDAQYPSLALVDVFECSCVLELATGCNLTKISESSSWSPRASFYREKGLPQWHIGGGKVYSG